MRQHGCPIVNVLFLTASTAWRKAGQAGRLRCMRSRGVRDRRQARRRERGPVGAVVADQRSRPSPALERLRPPQLGACDAPAAIYCASVSPSVRCVSTILRRTPASLPQKVRWKQRSVARRGVHHCAPLQVDLGRLDLALAQVCVPGLQLSNEERLRLANRGSDALCFR